MQKKSFHKFVKVVSIYIFQSVVIKEHVQISSELRILQNIDIRLYKVDWLWRIYTCQKTLVCSHILEARDRLLMLLEARSREVSTCDRSHTSPIHWAKAPFELTAGLCTGNYFGRLISKRVVAITPIVHTNNFIGTAGM